MSLKNKMTCPSYVAVPHAQVIGHINRDGLTSFSKNREILTSEMIKEYGDQELPIENNLRLAGLCAKGACHQWSTNKQNCSLGERVASLNLYDHYKDYKNCSIKDSCRWRAEQGKHVCPKCTTVIRYTQENLIG